MISLVQPKVIDKKKEKASAAAAEEKRRQEGGEQWRAIDLDILILSRTYKLWTAEMKKVYEFMLSIIYMALGN